MKHFVLYFIPLLFLLNSCVLDENTIDMKTDKKLVVNIYYNKKIDNNPENYPTIFLRW